MTARDILGQSIEVGESTGTVTAVDGRGKAKVRFKDAGGTHEQWFQVDAYKGSIRKRDVDYTQVLSPSQRKRKRAIEKG